jgi:hypothetical protein
MFSIQQIKIVIYTSSKNFKTKYVVCKLYKFLTHTLRRQLTLCGAFHRPFTIGPEFVAVCKNIMGIHCRRIILYRK